MKNSISTTKRTPEEERRLKISRDWYCFIHTYLDKKIRGISINLLEKELSIEKVFEVAGLSDTEQQQKDSHIWNKIIAALDKKKCYMPDFVKSVFDERISEIAMNLINMRISNRIELSNEDISDATRLPIQQIQKLKPKPRQMKIEKELSWVKRDKLEKIKEIRQCLIEML